MIILLRFVLAAVGYADKQKMEWLACPGRRGHAPVTKLDICVRRTLKRGSTAMDYSAIVAQSRRPSAASRAANTEATTYH